MAHETDNAPSESTRWLPEKLGFAFSFGLFLIALVTPALHMQSVNGYSDADYTGLDALLFGFLTLSRSLAWIANLFFFAALIFEWRKKHLFAFFATLPAIALSFTTFKLGDQGAAFFDPSSHNQQVASFDVAVYLWFSAQGVLAIFGLTQAILSARAKARRTREDERTLAITHRTSHVD